MGNDETKKPQNEPAADAGETGRPSLTEEDELAVGLRKGHEALEEGQLQEAADLLDDALFLARKLGDEPGEASACGLLAQVFLRLDEPEEAARHAESAVQIAQARNDEQAAHHFQGLLITARSGPEERRMSTTFGDGRAAVQNEDPQRAVPLLEEALSLAQKSEHQVAEGATRQFLAQAYLALDRREEAADMAAKSLEIAKALNDVQAVELASKLVQTIESGAVAPTETDLEAALETGKSALMEGKLEDAVEHLEFVRRQARQAGELVPEAGACGLLAQVFIETGQRDGAVEHAKRALEIAEQLGNEEVAESFRALLHVADASAENHAMANEIQEATRTLRAGNPDEAIAHLQTALQIALDHDNVVGEALARGLLAQAHHKLGNREDAMANAKRAREIFAECGDEEATDHFEEILTDQEDQEN